MALTDKVKNIADQLQEEVKTSSINIFTLVLRFITGLFLATTLTVIAQELIGFGQLGFIFMSIVICALFIKISTSWRIHHLLIFNLIYVLMGQLLRMYILLAP